MAKITAFPLSFNGIQPPLNLLEGILGVSTTPTQLTYPIDLGTNPNYGHAIVFDAQQQNFANLQSYVNNFTSMINPATASGINDTQHVAPYISLYLPDTLNTTYNHNWGELSLTQELPGGATFLAGAAADVAHFSNKGTDKDKGAYTNLLGKGLAGSIASGINPALGGVLQQAIGVVQNPHLQLLYKGIGLREFQFEFIFTPSSSHEANQVDQIIKQFTYWSVPSKGGNGVSNNYLIPPNLFKIKFLFLNGSGLAGAVTNFFSNIGTNILGSQITSLLSPSSIKPESKSTAKIFEIYNNCALTNMMVDYAPNGWAAYQDGYPIQTRMTLQFKETDIVTKESISKTSSLNPLPSVNNMNDYVNSVEQKTISALPSGNSLSDLGGQSFSDLTNMNGFP